MKRDSVRKPPARQNRDARAGWKGFFLAVALYLLLSVQQPASWSIPVWVLLALLVVPGSVGIVVGRGLDESRTAFKRFRTASRACGFAMFCYAAINLMVLHSRIQSGGDTAQVFLVGAVVTLVYTFLAGAIAGGISILAGSRKQKVGRHEPAS